MSSWIEELDAELRSGSPGLIQLRQTTYWDVCLGNDPTPRMFRIHFRGKQEHRYTGDEFAGGGFFTEHPLLRSFNESSVMVYLAGELSGATSVLPELRSVAEQWSDGWRTAEEYLNDLAWPEEVIAAGYGLLMDGPESLVSQCAHVLTRSGVKFSTLAGREACLKPQRVMVLGSSFVIAHTFAVETDN